MPLWQLRRCEMIYAGWMCRKKSRSVAFTVAFLTDGLWWNDGGCMLGVVPRELWKREHPPDEQNRIRLNLTCPLIIKGRDAILVDTGIGNRLSSVERKIFSHSEGWLPDHLRAMGMEPGDITHVILSHLHFDHCGGLIRKSESGNVDARISESEADRTKRRIGNRARFPQ